jgi:hypothetical protein
MIRQVASVICAAAAMAGAIATSATAAPEPTPEPLTESLPPDVVGFEVEHESLLAPDICLPDTTPASLDTLFFSEPASIIGADYPRTLPLPSGEVLWTFQDAKMRLPNGGIRVLHNIGMVQHANCFTLLRSGTTSNPRSWLFADQTTPMVTWHWPLDAAMGTDGNVYVYVAEMREIPLPEPDPDDPDAPPPGDGYLDHTVPVATRVARVDPETWNVEWYGTAYDVSADLYGFSIESDAEWTYFFAQCHRQFGFDPYIFGVLAHDRSCSDRVTVARVPRGQLFEPYRYWNGLEWVLDKSQAVPIIDQSGRFASPTQFLFRNNHWTAVTKLDDWWGDEIVVEQARRPTGPFDEIARFRAQPKCDVDCNTYFASWADGQNDEVGDAPLTVSLSHNRWDGTATSFYRPTFFHIDAPPDIAASADRCVLGHCD